MLNLLTINELNSSFIKIMEIIKVAIVEDNRFLREGLTSLINLTNGFQCVGAYPDATDIAFHIRRTAPQVVLMDIDLPSKMNGIEATRHLKSEFPALFILIQTVFEEESKICQAINAGAAGYVLKSMPPAKLLEAIADTAAGGAPMTPSVAKKIMDMVRNAKISMEDAPKIKCKLTACQQKVAEGIAQGKSYKMIAEELKKSVDVIKFHLKNIYSILDIDNRYDLAEALKKN
jgi:DNA-binding NarL/FixJ family response regulator